MYKQRLHTKSERRHHGVFLTEALRQHCAVLGFDAIPSLPDLRKSYKLLVKQWHPDKFNNRKKLQQLAVQKTQKINLAYRALLDAITEAPPEGESGVGPAPGSNSRHQYSWQKYTEGFPDDEAKEFFLNSSHVVSAGYSKKRQILYLKFLGDEIYLYFDVPAFVFKHLLLSKSPGKYAMRFIYKRFRHRKFMPLGPTRGRKA